jgi:hypothetical protein
LLNRPLDPKPATLAACRAAANVVGFAAAQRHLMTPPREASATALGWLAKLIGKG